LCANRNLAADGAQSQEIRRFRVFALTPRAGSDSGSSQSKRALPDDLTTRLKRNLTGHTGRTSITRAAPV